MTNDELKKIGGVRRLTLTYVLVIVCSMLNGSALAESKIVSGLKLVVSKDAELCAHMTKAIKEFNSETAEKPAWNQLTGPIKWRPGSIKLVIRGYPMLMNLEIAEFDIDNDGANETVSWWRHWDNEKGYDDLVIYSNKVPKFNGEEIDRTKEPALPGVKSSAFQGRDYKIDLTAAPEIYRKSDKYRMAALGPSFVEPFIYKSKTFLLITEEDIYSRNSPNWVVVAMYERERFPLSSWSGELTNKLNMLCVFEF